MARVWPLLGLLLAALALGTTHALEYKITQAVCVLKPTIVDGQTFPVSGSLNFVASGSNVDVTFSIDGLTLGLHELAIHRHGDLHGRDASSVRGKVHSFETVNVTNDASTHTGSFTQLPLTLNGDASIVGRSIVVYGNDTDLTIPVAYCVIGRKANDATATEDDRSNIARAVCHLSTADSATPVSGFLEFEKVSAGVNVRLIATGLSDGDHGMHVHLWGDISAADGMATAGHFIEGDRTVSTPIRDEIGLLGPVQDNTYPWAGTQFSVNSKEGVTRVFFLDKFIALSGINSIIGRSVVIHAGPTAGARVAQCVIGIASEQARSDPPVMNPAAVGSVRQVTAASAVITGYGSNPVNGYIDFEVVGENDPAGATAGHVRIRYFVTGLAAGNHGWHVHMFGNESSDPMATSGHFIGTNPTRPAGQLQEIGLLADGAPMIFDSNEVAQGEVIDTQIRLNGVNSIIGRSVVVHDVDSAPRMARGIIGRTRESLTQLETENTIIKSAVCHLHPTIFGTQTTAGVIRFDAIASGVQVTYDLSGLPDGSHGWHIHDLGDISGDAALSTTGHFIGCNPQRPVGQLQEVGLMNDGIALTVTGGSASGSFDDTQMRLNGLNTILGRALVIHGNQAAFPGNTAVRSAMCVIGLTEETQATPANTNRPTNNVPYVTTARCDLRPTSTSPFPNVAGYFEFTQNMGSIDVEYMITGMDDSDHYFHVHQFGDIFTLNGMSVRDHYIGNPDTGSGRKEVGELQLAPLTPDNGQFVGTFTDVNNANLNYMNNIIARSMIVHGDGVNPLARVAQCVIGITGENPSINMQQDERLEVVNRAVCSFEGTNQNPGPVTGYIQFEYDANYNLATRIFVHGLTPGDHMFHVHTYGDISAADGSATQGHFQGQPVGSRLEVGELGDNYMLKADANGFASAYFVDTEAKLSGRNSILGRSIIIHGNAESAGARVAQCVVGIMMEDEYLPHSNTTHGTVPLVTQAAAVVVPISSSSDLKGQIEFFQQERNDVRSEYGSRLRYTISGLLPNGVHYWAINQFGDAAASGSSFQGCANRTLRGVESAVGAVGKLYPMVANAQGVAKGEVVDRYMSLNGLSSVIGRTLVIYPNGTDISGAITATPIATAVIGRSKEIAAVKAMPPPVATQAVCHLQPTRKNGASNFGGTITFSQASPSAAVSVSYTINNFPATGRYPWHVHQWGDLIGFDDAISTAGHFIGSHFLRPMCVLQEVGNINDGTPLDVTNVASLTGSFTDDVIELSGPNSIIGRAIVVHSSVNSADRIAYCVIGVKAEQALAPEACLSEPAMTNHTSDSEPPGPNPPGGQMCDDGIIRQVCPTPAPQSSSDDHVPLIVGLTVGLGGGLLLIGGALFFMKSRGATLYRSKEIAGAEMQRV